jgi:FecR protein
MGAQREREMVYGSSTEGGYGIGVSTDHVDASHADRIDISDAELLFRGHFARSGPDLVLTGQDGHRLVVTGYFASEKHPDLVAPNGAHLTGDLVDLLAGSPTPGQYAQAKTTLPPEAIGKVEKVVGHVTLIHNGVAGPLHVGDPVYKTDVVETAANSSCGIAFPDGTALDLVNNTRMALNEYNYEANSASNGAIFSLVEGTFAFVAGQVAHTGEGMKINTPVATMGIRGTVGLFRSEPTVINANLGHVWSVFLHEDIDGSHHLGRIAFIDQDPTSPTFGQVFYLLDSSEYIAYLEPQGPGSAPHVRLEPITNSKIFDDRHFYDDLGQILNAYQTGTVNPESVPGTPGSGDNPSLLFQQQFQDDFGHPLFNLAKPTGSGDPPTFVPPGGPFLPPIPVMPGANPNNNTPNGQNTSGPTTPPPPPPSGPHVFIWNSTGAQSWSQALADWNQGSAPNLPADQVIIASGTSNYDINGITTIASLIVDPGATLNIKAGELIVTGNVIDNGTININSDPLFVINGPATIGSTHTLTVTGSGNEVDFNGSLLNQGTVTAGQGGTVLIDGSAINSGIIQAIDDGQLKIVNTTITNSITDSHGNIVDGTIFVGSDSHLVLDNATIMQGIVHVGSGGEIDTVSGTNNTINTANGPSHNTTVPSITIDEGGSVVVNDNSSLALASPFNIENNGTIELKSTGHAAILYFNQPDPILAGHGLIVLDGGSGSQDIIAGLTGQGFTTVNLDNQGNTIEGAGAIGQNDGALTFTNDIGSTINADLKGQTLYVETGALFTNNALMEATNGGTLDVLDDVAGKGSVAISGGGSAMFAGAFSQDVAFSGTGTLELAHSLGGTYGGTITGFGGGDVLILDDLAFSQGEYAVWCNNVLTIYDGETVEKIKLVGNYSKNSFAIVDDGGKTEVVFVGDEWTGSLPVSSLPEDRSGSWNLDPNWTLGVPKSTLNAIIDLPGKYTVTMSGDQAANSLTITDADATLTGSGSLTLGSLENHGTIETTDDETLVINIKNASTNFGTIKADGGVISFGPVTLTNEPGDGPGGKVEATNWGTITFNGGIVENGQVDHGKGALFLANDHGTITFEGSESNPLGVTNQSGAEFEAKGYGSFLKFEGPNVEVINDGGTFLAKDGGKIVFNDIFDLANCDGGKIKAKDGGTVAIHSSYVDNKDGVIAAIGWAAAIVLADTAVAGGAVEARHYGVVDLDHATIIGSTLATDCGGLVQTVCGNSTLQNVTIAWGSDVLVNDGTSLTLVGDIHSWGAIVVGPPQSEGDPDLVIKGDVTLDGSGSVVLNGRNDYVVAACEGGTLTNDSNIVGAGHIGDGGGLWLDNAKDGTIDADMWGGRLTLDTGWHAVTNAGLLESTGGILEIRSDVDNAGGVIGAYGPDGLVKLFGVTIAGGTLATDCGGTIEVVAMRGDDTNMSVFDGSNGHAVTIDGYVLVDSGANLELVGTIHNHGTIEIDGKQTDLVIDGNVTLEGHGTILLDSAKNPADQIVGLSDSELSNKLDNVNNTIEGAGNIGTGNGNLWLVNESHGTIEANDEGQTLTVATGHNAITNAGTLAASNDGTLDVESSVSNSGGSIKVFDGGFADFEKSVTGGTATIHGGTLEFDAASSVAVTFDNGGGRYGELILGDVKDFSGTIFGFDGQDSEHPSLATTDEIDLVGIASSNVSFSHDGDDAIIRITKNGQTIATITLDDFNYHDLEKASDGHGGTIIFDPPANASTGPSVSIGGAGNDTFVFHPGEGAQTVNNFNPQNETIELDHFANIENMQELAAAITPDAHGNAVLELGHGDSIAIPGVSATFLQQNLQSLVHLHA